MVEWIPIIIVIGLIFTIIGFFVRKAIKLLIIIWLGFLVLTFIDEIFGLTIISQLQQWFQQLFNTYAK